MPGFGASKGWLDKFINRANIDLKYSEDLPFFRIIPYSEKPFYEENQGIVDCLIGMNCPSKIVEQMMNDDTNKKINFDPLMFSE